MCKGAGARVFLEVSMRRNLSSMVFILAGLLIMAGCNSAEKNAPVAGPIAFPSPASSVPSDGVRRITIVELRDLLARNEAFVVDVRDNAAFQKGHIRGAKLMPVGEILSHADELPTDKLIVTYCS